jgi:hypothetical protein
MRFDLHQNVMCLLYEHPLLLERCRCWTPKNHELEVEHLQRPQAENRGRMTAVESDDIFRFEGEGGLESLAPGAESIATPPETVIWPGPSRVAPRTASRSI